MAEDTSNNDRQSKPIPDPETKDNLPKKRRNLTVRYKLEILKEVKACKGNPGAIGALLRREGLYSSHIGAWKKERNDGLLSIDSETKRGRKAKFSQIEIENNKLKKELSSVKLQLEQSQKIIQAQKKIAELFETYNQETQSSEEEREKTS